MFVPAARRAISASGRRRYSGRISSGAPAGSPTGQPAVVDCGDPVKLRVVVRDRRSRALQNCLNSTAPSPIASTLGPSVARRAASSPGAIARGSRNRCCAVSPPPALALGHQPAANTSPRRASITASDRAGAIAPRSAAPRGAPPSASDCERRDADERDPARAAERLGRRDPDPQPGERAWSDARRRSGRGRAHETASRSSSSTISASRRVACRGRSPGGRVVACLGSRPIGLAQIPQRDRRRPGRGVEAEDPHADLHRPACRRRRARVAPVPRSARAPPSSRSAPCGHSTNAIVSGRT